MCYFRPKSISSNFSWYIESRLIFLSSLEKEKTSFKYVSEGGCPSEEQLCMYLDEFFTNEEKKTLENHIIQCIKCIETINEIEVESAQFKRNMLATLGGNPKSLDVIGYIETCSECFLNFLNLKGRMSGNEIRRVIFNDSNLVEDLYNRHIAHWRGTHSDE